MEGLVDAPLRAVLTRIGGIDGCVTEFVRVSGNRLPTRTFRRLAPEWQQGWKTAAGVPVKVQLLGSDPESLADNAAVAVALGSPAIDLNFGCPAKGVNRHRGGAVLLQEPELLQRIVQAVRQRVPAGIPVTAKMRLGYEDKSLALDCACALVSGGASELVVHARTKLEAYRPPAHWAWIARIREVVSVPVVANGEIWTVEDFLRCRSESGCEAVMLGRGLVAQPDLALQIRAALAGTACPPWAWPQIEKLLPEFYRQVRLQFTADGASGRLKQWLGYLRRTYPEADSVFKAIRETRQLDEALRNAGPLG